jgi:hypothetical protein
MNAKTPLEFPDDRATFRPSRYGTDIDDFERNQASKHPRSPWQSAYRIPRGSIAPLFRPALASRAIRLYMRAVDFRPIDPKARATSTLVAFADVYLQNLDHRS